MRSAIHLPRVALSVMALAFLAIPSFAQESKEPSYEVINSGTCIVPVCTDIEFGNYFFRLYAPDYAYPTVRKIIHDIPKGACTCQKIETQKRHYTQGIGLGVEKRDLARNYRVSIGLDRSLYEGDVDKAVKSRNRTYKTTFEILQERLTMTGIWEIQKTSDFLPEWKPDFRNFTIYQSRYAGPQNTHNYFFHPNHQTLVIDGESQDVAFDTHFKFPREIKRSDGVDVGRLYLEVFSTVRMHQDVFVNRAFYAATAKPDTWIQEWQDSVRVIDDRLRLKSQN